MDGRVFTARKKQKRSGSPTQLSWESSKKTFDTVPNRSPLVFASHPDASFGGRDSPEMLRFRALT